VEQEGGGTCPHVLNSRGHKEHPHPLKQVFSGKKKRKLHL
jgi:hypothetical protein